MRLINAKTLKLEEFVGDNIPSFFILSHRWGTEEITFEDFVEGRRKDALGYKKIVACCEFILRRHDQPDSEDEDATDDAEEDLQFYVWIDTVCIDKKSSADLSEAINSMFSYYSDAVICLAYLSDVEDYSPEQFAASSWFTRGWTLQELLAPDCVIFLDRQWQVIGRKGVVFYTGLDKSRRNPFYCDEYGTAAGLGNEISKITGIDTDYLKRPSSIQNATVATRMSWAANRKTLRIEDTAYSLLGLFDVNMPLLYGEGTKAFRRLQEELIRKSNDQSIFAWWTIPSDLAGSYYEGEYYRTKKYARAGILAPSPAHFQRSGKICHLSASASSTKLSRRARPYALTNLGLEFHDRVQRVQIPGLEQDLVYSMQLNCARDRARDEPVEILLWYVGDVDPTALYGMYGKLRMESDGPYERLVGVCEEIPDKAIVEKEEEDNGAIGEPRDEQRLMYVTPARIITPILRQANFLQDISTRFRGAR